MAHSHAIEHGSSRAGRWLRERRLRLTLWLAAFEGLLYVLHVLHWWAAVALAVIAVGLYWFTGRANRSDSWRQLTWIFASVQLLVLVVPLALGLVKAVAIGVLALLAIVALVVLFTERR
jgi:hypothetical protein